MIQVYDDPIGSFRVKAYRYRVMTFCFLGIALFLGLYFVILVQKPREKVLAVQVLSTGAATGVAYLEKQHEPV